MYRTAALGGFQYFPELRDSVSWCCIPWTRPGLIPKRGLIQRWPEKQMCFQLQNRFIKASVIEQCVIKIP
jgi:hypothetical protein